MHGPHFSLLSVLLSVRVSGCPWAAQNNTWLFIKLMPKGVVLSFLFLFLFCLGRPHCVWLIVSMLNSLEHLFSVCPGTDVSVKAKQRACAAGRCAVLLLYGNTKWVCLHTYKPDSCQCWTAHVLSDGMVWSGGRRNSDCKLLRPACCLY